MNVITTSATDFNKKQITRLYEEILNERKFDLLGDFISENYVGPNGAKGIEGFKQPVLGIINSLPDIRWEIQEIVASNHTVAVRWKVIGTQTGPFQTFAPTGKIASSEGIGFIDLVDGKVTASRVMTDRLGFLQQLGILPNDLSQLTSSALTAENIIFIDKFFVPAAAYKEFMTRVNINRKMIHTLPGFIEDAAYERKDEHGNYIFMTIAIWRDGEALQSAKAFVQARYKDEGFDPAEMMRRLNIIMDRATYTMADVKGEQ